MRVGQSRDHHEGDAEQGHLRERDRWFMSMNCGMNAPKKISSFGLESSTSKALQEEAAARRRRRCVGVDALDGRADQLDAEPDQIGGAGKAHPVEPVAHGRHQRGQADRDDADHDQQAGLHAGDVDQRRAGAVAQAVGDQQRDHRTGQQRQRDAGGDKGEIDLQGHGGLGATKTLARIMHDASRAEVCPLSPSLRGERRRVSGRSGYDVLAESPPHPRASTRPLPARGAR